MLRFIAWSLVTFAVSVAAAGAQPPAAPAAGAPANPKPAESPAAVVPSDYKIGVGDVLNVVFWREPEMSGEVTVRPDGRITLPLLKEMMAVGYSPTQLEQELTTTAKQFIQEPNVTVVVREIKSRQVFITGMVARPGSYALTGPITVLQFIAQAGGLLEYAKGDKILVMRNEGGKARSLPFNYKDIVNNRNLSQNVELLPGDTVIVP